MDKIASLRLIIVAAVISNSLRLYAQPAGTDIYIADLSILSSKITVGEPSNITTRAGYDNQPNFLPDGQSLLYSSIREDRQSDTYLYNLATGSTTRMTETSDGEYSPTIMPGWKAFSVIRQDSMQKLWKYPLDGSDPSVILPDITPVGYHAWGNEDTVVLFVLGDSLNPNTLQIVDVSNGNSRIVAERVGRSLHKIPGKNLFSFVHKTSEKEWWIKQIGMEDHRIEPIVRITQESEDYAWMSGTILMGRDTILLKYKPGVDQEWVQIADLAEQGISKISRLAISPDDSKIAIVSADCDCF